MDFAEIWCDDAYLYCTDYKQETCAITKMTARCTL